eukprot:7379508-Prymnesium_polylepis.2
MGASYVAAGAVTLLERKRKGEKQAPHSKGFKQLPSKTEPTRGTAARRWRDARLVAAPGVASRNGGTAGPQAPQPTLE